MISLTLTGGMIAAAAAGVCFACGLHGLFAFLGEFITHFWEVNG